MQKCMKIQYDLFYTVLNNWLIYRKYEIATKNKFSNHSVQIIQRPCAFKWHSPKRDVSKHELQMLSGGMFSDIFLRVYDSTN